MDEVNRIITKTPIGKLAITCIGECIVGIQHAAPRARSAANKRRFFREVERQLQAYFDGTLQEFDIPFSFESGTDFQERVWWQISRIPYGQTRTYGEIAGEIKSGPRAVGGACAHNGLLLIIPCHRVIGVKGLGGFMGDVDGSLVRRKQWLLEHERRHTT